MSGLLGAMEGLGKGISQWGETIVKTELEKAKELRDRNFKREMYEQARTDQVEDRDILRHDTKIRDAAQDERRRFEREEDYSNQRLAQLAANKRWEEEMKLKKRKLDAEIKALNAKSGAAASDSALKIWQEVEKNLDNVNQRIQGLYKEAGGMEISPEIAAEIGRLENQRKSYLGMKEALDSQITDPVVQSYLQNQRKIALDDKASAAGISPEEYQKIAKANPDDKTKESIAQRFLQGDKEAEIFMAVQQTENISLWHEINSHKDKLKTSLDIQSKDSEAPQGLLHDLPRSPDAPKTNVFAQPTTDIDSQIIELRDRIALAGRHGSKENTDALTRQLAELERQKRKQR